MIIRVHGAANAESDSLSFMLESGCGTSYGMFNARTHAVSGSARVCERADPRRKPTANIFIQMLINNGLAVLAGIYRLSYMDSANFIANDYHLHIYSPRYPNMG